MSFLTIAGVEYQVLADNTAAEQQREYNGSLRRAFDMTLRNTTRVRKRQWSFSLAPMAAATLATLDAATSLRQIVACAGDALGGSVNCAVILQAAGYVYSMSPAAAVALATWADVGGASWALQNTPTRVANNFTCTSDGTLLDLIGDDSVVTTEGFSRTVPYTTNGDKVLIVRVARGNATVALVYVYDATTTLNTALIALDFRTTTLIVTAVAGQGGVLYVRDFGDGSYDVAILAPGVIAAHSYSMIVYPSAGFTAADVGTIHMGKVRHYESVSAAEGVGFLRTASVILMEQ